MNEETEKSTEPKECNQTECNQTNLNKKSKTNESLDKFEFTGVLVNGKVYNFSLKSLMEKEPATNLLNINEGEIKKRVNKRNHTIEYIEQIPDFNLIIDYINGYHYKNFEKVFNTDYARVESFRLLLIKLGMTNLIEKLNWSYPLLNINGIMYTVSTKLIYTLEPRTNLFDSSRKLSSTAFTHFKDSEIFNEYFRDYLLGTKTLIEAAEHINRLKEKQQENENNNSESYILAKIKNDLYYYGLSNLEKQVFDISK